jgi:hypothetical protein
MCEFRHGAAFFGCMYYAALRPEEATELRRSNLTSLPNHGWGEMTLTNSEPRSGSSWTDDGTVRQRSTLKHRAPGETRPVPIHPELVTLLRDHLKRYGTGPRGRVFTLARGGVLTDRAYLAVFHKARAAAFTEDEAASLLARRPYDLRHAAVSTWLKATADPPQVAEWAGHSVAVLLRVYAKCIAGQQDEAKRRILEATKPTDTDDGAQFGDSDSGKPLKVSAGLPVTHRPRHYSISGDVKDPLFPPASVQTELHRSARLRYGLASIEPSMVRETRKKEAYGDQSLV